MRLLALANQVTIRGSATTTAELVARIHQPSGLPLDLSQSRWLRSQARMGVLRGHLYDDG